MSSFIRKRVRGLLKTTFSNTSNHTDESHHPQSTGSGSTLKQTDFAEDNVIYERILNGRNGKKVEIPETYAGKTGLDLPVIHLDVLKKQIRSCFTGPDGGLTKVGQMRQQPIVRMANLDDELSLSSYDENEEEFDGDGKTARLNVSTDGGRLNNSHSMEALGFLPSDLAPSCSTDTFNWASSNPLRSFGVSTSLYEKHPVTGMNAGTPIADVFGIIARENNAIMALADGVNWGEGARLAARCAIRGALDHLNAAVEKDSFETTTDIFHSMLGAFHAGHSLILQEGGALTTLCVAIVAPIRNSDNYALCVVCVGDSLCFVYNHASGVREVTLASHDIAQMRDMRDAGGALGPVDGRNPQLHNLTCSMTFVQEGDIVFITSDGVSDNFDPVVGKFCVIKAKEESEKENCELIEDIAPKSKGNQFFNRGKTPQIDPVISCIPQRQRCNATLPCIDAFGRHELMLLRMADVIANGVNLKNHFFEDNGPYVTTEPHTPESGIGTPSSHNTVTSPRVSRRNSTTAAEVCKNLVSFAQQLSAGKRKTLEDPEIYRSRTHSKTEEKLRRKMIRNMIMEMPGKLDHASVVAFKVGEWDPPETLEGSLSAETPVAVDIQLSHEPLESQSSQPLTVDFKKSTIGNCTSLFCKPSEFRSTAITLVREDFEQVDKQILKLDLPPELETEAELAHSPRRRATRSPYEEQPITVEEVSSPTRAGVIPRNKKKSHARNSLARHTLGVDVAWLKRLVINRQPSNETVFHPPLASHSSQMNSQSSMAESPMSSTPPGSKHHRPSFSPPDVPRPFSFKKFFMKPTKSDANCLPYRSPNDG